MSQQNFDLVCIGGGIGGYVAAIRAAQLGLNCAIIESRGTLGGTCLNVGCIPSKALLQSTEAYHATLHRNQDLGVIAKDVSFDVEKMLKRKDAIVKSLTSGVEGLMKKNKITYFKGFGSFKSAHEVLVKGLDGSESLLTAKNIIIATGSEPIELSIAKFDEKDIVSSTGALEFQKPPKHLVVVGGGVIGLELGSVWARLGSKVTVIEAMTSILPMMDGEIIKTMTKVLKRDGLEFFTSAKFQAVKRDDKGLKVSFEQDGKLQDIDCDKLLIAVGRRAYTKGLNAEKAGVLLDDRGRVKIDQHFRSSVSHIYAVGDVVSGAMLAHKAEEEGVACAEIIAGKPGHVNYEAIPNVVYTWPEVASIGRSEEQCKEEKLDVKIGKYLYLPNGRAKAMGETEGFVKLIADAKTDRLVGAHIVGANASEMIGELALAFEYQASSEDIARTVHAHPTLMEIVKEAALAVDKRAIHM